jgi:hypothetical protein
MDGPGDADWHSYSCSVGPSDSNTASYNADTSNPDEPITIARNLQWFAIGTAP